MAEISMPMLHRLAGAISAIQYKMFYIMKSIVCLIKMNIKACISLLHSYSIINVINNSFFAPCEFWFTYDDIYYSQSVESAIS